MNLKIVFKLVKKHAINLEKCNFSTIAVGTFQIRYEFDNQPPTEKVSPVNNTARLDTLPSEVLMNIFGNLPIEDVVLNLPCVCNKFFELLKTRVTRRNLNVHIASNTTFQRKPYFFPCEMGLIAQLVLGNAVESISLTVYKHVDRINFPSHLLSFIGRKCKFVSIRYYAGVEVFNSLEKSDCFEKVLWRISTFSKVLTFVYIWPYYSFNGLNSGSDWPVLPSVKNLSIQFNSEREVMKAQHLSEKFPNLERFCYDDHKPRSAAGLCSELGNQGRTIPWKALSVKKYPDSFAWNLFQDLQTLELTPSENFFSDEFFEQCVLDFEKNRHLKHLFLHFPEYFSEGQVLNFVDTFPVNLEVLILDFGSFQIEDYQANIIERLVTRCPKLETLYLKFFSSINPFNIMRIYESLPNLRRLIVNDVEQHETNCCISWIPQTVQGSLQLIRGPAMDDLNELFFW